jgi:hypothetical protein
LVNTTRAFDPAMLVWTICRSVWLVNCVKGNGAKAWPGGGATAAGCGAAGHRLFVMNGASAGAAGGGFCGRPTSAVIQVPTQRSPLLLWARMTPCNAKRAKPNATTVTTLCLHCGCRFGDVINCSSLFELKSIPSEIEPRAQLEPTPRLSPRVTAVNATAKSITVVLERDETQRLEGHRMHAWRETSNVVQALIVGDHHASAFDERRSRSFNRDDTDQHRGGIFDRACDAAIFLSVRLYG